MREDKRMGQGEDDWGLWGYDIRMGEEDDRGYENWRGGGGG